MNNASNQQKDIQLFLLPFAGGSGVSFRCITDLLDARIEPITVEYAGRGERRHEDFISDYCQFRDDVANYINLRRDSALPYAVLGYSLGAALAFDILSNQMILGGKPQHVFICARGCPKASSPSQLYAFLKEDEFIEKVKLLGGIDERILANKRFADIYLRPLRADYHIWGQYCYSSQTPKLESDMSVFFSMKDPTCLDPYGWAEMTKRTVDFFEMGENHFFLYQHYDQIAKIINNHLYRKPNNAEIAWK